MESEHNRATGGSARSATDKVKSDATDVVNKVKSDTAELAQDVKRRGEQRFDSQKQAAADQAKSLAGVVERAAEDLREQDQQSLAQYAGQLADSMKSFADSLKSRSTDDLIRDTQDLARRNPTLFVLGSVAVGVALSRFFKASGDREGRQQRNFHPSAEYGGQPATFESRPGTGSGPGTAPITRPSESPSFADDLDKGV
jgi:hypothetical protein